MTRNTLRGLTLRVATLTAVLALAAGCSSSGGDTAQGSTTPSSTDDSGQVTDTSPTEEPSATETITWQKMLAPRPCACSDGSEFHYWVKKANPEKVLFYLNGGGACFSKETCFTAQSFTPDLSDDEPLDEGIFDASNPDNPFADYSIVTVPYCTGDLHIGTISHDYGTADDPAVIRHVGAINGGVALTTAAALFPDAQQVVVAGGSAGAASSPMYSGLASDLFPDAEVINIADAAGGYPDNPLVTRTIGSLWGIANAVPGWPGAPEPASDAWSLPGMTVQASKHSPGIHFARLDYANDEVQEGFNQLAGLTDGALIDAIDANEKTIRDSGANVSVWLNAGTDHTILGEPEFYTTSINDVRLSDWLTKLVTGAEVDDERCATCSS